MDVHVDQSRQQRLAGQVDAPDVGGEADGAGIGDLGDPPVLVDEDGRMIDIAPGGDIEIAFSRDDGRLFGRFRAGGNGQCQQA